MPTYHINLKGEAGPCSATKGNCPFASAAEHYPTIQAAREAYEASQNTSLPEINKKEVVWATVVPEAIMEAEWKKVPAGQLVYGQNIMTGSDLRTVKAVKLGYKNAVLTVTDLQKGERNLTVPLDQEMETEVFNETKESLKTRRAAGKELFLEKQVKTYTPMRNKVVEKINEKVAKGYPLDGYNLAELTEAEAKDNIMARYTHWVENVREYEPEALNPYTHALEKYRDELRQEVIQSSRRGNSVSTSEAHNYFERELEAAKAEFLTSGPALMF